MNAIPLLSSALLAVAVFLAARYGRTTLTDLLSKYVRADRDKYGAWAHSLRLGWGHQDLRRLALVSKALILVIPLIVYWLTGSIVFAIAMAAVVGCAPAIYYRLAWQRRIDQLEDQLPEAVDVLVASVRAGRSLQQAITDAAIKMPAPIQHELQLITDECQRGGVSLLDALERARDRVKLESFTMIASALAINLTQGGDLLTMLERMSQALRELIRLKHKIATETSEVRAQEKIILVMTPLFGLMVCAFDPDIPRILFHTMAGNLLLVVVAALQSLSIYWIRRILKSTI